MSEGPLEVTGPAAVSVVLEGTPAPEQKPLPLPGDLMERADALGVELRALIVEVKRLPRTKGLDPHQDPVRSLAIAQTDLQTGFMWLRRAIACPKVF